MSGAPATENRSPFVGRSRELRRLASLIDETLEGRNAATVIVVGEAGIGKSRLIREFVDDAAERRPGLAVLQGRCPAGGAGSAYWPLAEALREASGSSLAADTRTAVAALRRHLRGLFPAGGRERDELTQALAVTASLTLARNPLEQAEPKAVDAAILRTWPRYLSARTGRFGAVVVIEDVHWADPQLLRVIAAVHAGASGGLLVLVTTRPELADRQPGFLDQRERWSVLNLTSLPRPEGERLVRELLHAPGLGGSLAGAIAGRAEGNPLYIEQAIRLLADTGALRLHAETVA